MHKVFHTQKTITFREADPAGILFFGNIFGLAHDAFEQFIVAAGYTYASWFGQRDLLIPIRHTEADFKSPFKPGMTYDIHVTVAQFGSTSFKMKYVFSREARTHATVWMVHSVLNGQTHQKETLPDIMKQRLQPYLEAPSSVTP